MTTLSFLGTLILGLVAGKFVLGLLVSLIVRIPFILRLQRFGFVIHNSPFIVESTRIVFILLAVFTLVILGTATNSFTKIPFYVGLLGTIGFGSGRLFGWSRYLKTYSDFSKDFSKYLLPGWELISISQRKTCLKCQQSIPVTAFGLLPGTDILDPYPKVGEFGYCSEGCFENRKKS